MKHFGISPNQEDDYKDTGPSSRFEYWSIGILNLFRISDFGIRIWLRPKACIKIRSGMNLPEVENLRAKETALVLGHHVFDGFVKAVQGELIHGKNLSNDPDGAGVRPFNL